MRLSPLRPRSLLTAGLLAVLMTLLVAVPALADGTSVVFPAPVSPNGHRIYDLYVIVSWFAIPIFIGVEAGLLLIILRFRRRDADHYGATWHHNLRLEVAWTIAPAIIVTLIAVLSFVELDRDFNPDHFGKDVAAADQMNVCVQGYQFYWTYTYTDTPACDTAALKNAVVAKDTLVVPVGRFVHMTMHSDNVIHSWWVPAVSGKTDAVPGYDNQMFIQVEKAGTWEGECAELCGVGHYQMQIKLQALEASAFKAWYDKQKAVPPGKPAPSPTPTK